MADETKQINLTFTVAQHATAEDLYYYLGLSNMPWPGWLLGVKMEPDTEKPSKPVTTATEQS